MITFNPLASNQTSSIANIVGVVFKMAKMFVKHIHTSVVSLNLMERTYKSLLWNATKAGHTNSNLI